MTGQNRIQMGVERCWLERTCYRVRYGAVVVVQLKSLLERLNSELEKLFLNIFTFLDELEYLLGSMQVTFKN